MRPRTSIRTAQVVAVATGLATFSGVGTAAAEPDPELVPDEVGVTVPLAQCPPPEAGPRDGTPCADARLTASTPNVVTQVGSDIVRTGRGMLRELRDDEPLLAPGKPNRVLGHVFAETTRLDRMTRLRPTLDVRMDPVYEGVLDRPAPEGGFLEAKIGPRGPRHEGVSAVDTAVELTAARGYTVGSIPSAINAAEGTLAGAVESGTALVTRVGQVVPLDQRSTDS